MKCRHAGLQGAREAGPDYWLGTREELGRILHSSSTGDASTFMLITMCIFFFHRLSKLGHTDGFGVLEKMFKPGVLLTFLPLQKTLGK